MDAAMIVGQIAGRMFDPIGWIVMVGRFFAFRAAKPPTWAAWLGAAVVGAFALQVLVMAMASGRQPPFVFGLSMWMLTGLVECGIAWLIAKGIRAMKSA